jgi:phosphodiesterase/alkaline phosphatase D-like protein
LTGFVNTGGAATTYFFEYGTHTPLDPTTRSRHTTKSGSVSIDVKHLKAHTRYYYRLIAKNRKGEVHGKTRSFRTK